MSPANLTNPVSLRSPTEVDGSWAARNQRYLSGQLAALRFRLESRTDPKRADSNGTDSNVTGPTIEAPPFESNGADEASLDRIVGCFGLSPFERQVLLLCAGVELDGEIARLVDGVATFNTALALSPDAHWSALAPAAPLRRWDLIEAEPGPTLVSSGLRIGERILHYLAGVDYLDVRLEHMAGTIVGRPLPASQQAVADRVVALWGQAGELPEVVLTGPDTEAKRDIADRVAAAGGLRCLVIDAQSLPTGIEDLTGTARLVDREAVLSDYLVLIELGPDGGFDPAVEARAVQFAAKLACPSMVATRSAPASGRRLMLFEVEKPTADEQRRIWIEEVAHRVDSIESANPTEAAGPGDPVEVAARLAAQTNFDARSIHSAVTLAAAEGGDYSFESLWHACRRQARPDLAGLAQRIDSSVTFDDVVLGESQRSTLEEIAHHIAGKSTVYDRWGFRGRHHRGLGVSALFAGPSGTGKTMAAEALASLLQLDLWRIDLSQVVSKYIGETEKNLSHVFDMADENDWILFFDEADALFGKRSEVKDSHDRYANIEVSYLLQRMEEFTGLAVLTTNQEAALDEAFLRRIRFVVRFPAPDQAAREAIWRQAFPDEVPRGELDIESLAHANLSGGNIHNIALASAFRAAFGDGEVAMPDIETATRAELAKIGRRSTTTGNGTKP